MQSSPHDSSSPLEILPPLTKNKAEEHPLGQSTLPLSTYQQIKTFYHPVSGVVILGIDFIAFGTDVLTGTLALVPMCFLSFFVTLFGVFFIQHKWGSDGKASAFGKAFIGAVLAGLPFSIAGTMLGAAVLVLSGLPEPKDALRKLIKPSSNK